MIRFLRRPLPLAGLATAAVLAAPAYASAATVARYAMDETSGSTMVDAAGGDNNGTLHSIALAQPGGYLFGYAYGFNGSSSYADVPGGGTLVPGTRNVTLSIRMKTSYKPPSTVEDWDLFRKGLYSSGSEYKMEYYPSGQAGCAFRGSSAYTGEHPAGPVLSNNVWHTIKCVKTSTGMQTIVDGAVVYTRSGTIGSINTTDKLVVGARPGSEFFKGLLDEATVSYG
jgi:hypothetical protein